MKLLLILVLLLTALGRSYGQCRGRLRRFVPARQKMLFYSPGYNGPAYQPVSFMRADQNQQTSIYLIVRVPGDSAALQQGSWILFSDGTSLAWPTRTVGFKAEHGRPLWWGNNPLTAPQLVALGTKLISSVKVYQYEQRLTQAEAEQARALCQCVRDAKR